MTSIKIYGFKRMSRAFLKEFSRIFIGCTGRPGRNGHNRRPQIGNFQCGKAGVEIAGRAGPGRVGSGRVATETGIRNGLPSKRAQEKNTPFGRTPLTPIKKWGALAQPSPADPYIFTNSRSSACGGG